MIDRVFMVVWIGIGLMLFVLGQWNLWMARAALRRERLMFDFVYGSRGNGSSLARERTIRALPEEIAKQEEYPFQWWRPWRMPPEVGEPWPS